MSSAAKIIPDRLRENTRNFIFLDLNVDSDYNFKEFKDLIISLRFNYTLRFVTLVRNTHDEETGKPVVQRTSSELRTLVKEIVKLPRLEMLDFENFADSELNQFEDLLSASKQVQ